jgi:hypothetical protein
VDNRITVVVIAALSIGILLMVIFALMPFILLGNSAISGLSSDDAVRIVENDLQRRNSYRITDIAVDVPKFANYTLTYVSFNEFREHNMTLPLIRVGSNDNLTVTRIFENGSSEYVGECGTGFLTYCGYRPPFELDYEGKLVYEIEILASSNDNPKETLFYVVDAMDGEIVDSTLLRNDKVQQGLKILPT